MARRPKNSDPDILRRELIKLFQGFETYLLNGTLREKVLALVPAFRTLRDLGCSLIPQISPLPEENESFITFGPIPTWL